MKKHVIYLLVLNAVLMNACQKEVSFEAGKNRSHGSLQSDATGDCLPKTVNGVYITGKKLAPDTNTITVNVNVTTTGSYNISTDTVNGYYFRATGIFATQGSTAVTLKGNGTPLAAGTNNFVISYDSSECDIAVDVLPAGAGGPASFALTNTSGGCTSTVNGTYTLNTALTAPNTVDIAVDVTAIGTYNITTAATGGMTFSASGTFTATGPNTVTLQGAGTPTALGTNTIPITAGTSSCSFVVNVVGASVGTLGATAGACTPATPSGTYTMGAALTTANTVVIQVNITTKGGYSITTNTVAGMKFTASGNFASTGVQNVTLNGEGTPTASGSQTFTVTYGSSTCTFSINVGSGAQYAVDCSSVAINGNYTAGTALDASNTIDLDVNVTATGPYNISGSGNGMTFTASGSFSSTGTNSITLNGSGTPTAAGNFNIMLGSCTMQVTVDAALTIDWKFTEGANTYQGSTDDAQLDISIPPFTLFSYSGSSPSSDLLSFSIADIASGILNNETYNTNSTTSNAAGFVFSSTSANYSADQTTAGVNLTFKVTSHNTITKTITGTFSGTVKNGSNVTKTITNGQFTAAY